MWTVPWEMCRFSLQDEYKNAGLRTCIFVHTGTQMKYTGKLTGSRFAGRGRGNFSARSDENFVERLKLWIGKSIYFVIQYMRRAEISLFT